MLEKLEKIVENIEGWLSKKECVSLFSLAKECSKNGVIVEIGSYKGRSTVCLGRGSKEGNNVKIYAVDPQVDSLKQQKEGIKTSIFDDFLKNIKNSEVEELVIPIVETSEKAARDFNKPVELIFIDGSHKYENVKLDFDLWFPKVMDGGIMAFHDTISCWPGPERVVNDMLYKSRYFKKIKVVDSITFAQKVSKNSLRDCIENRIKFFFKNTDMYIGLIGIFLKNRIPKVYLILKRLKG